jgi:DNA-binding transcriptional LysR family regulator
MGVKLQWDDLRIFLAVARKESLSSAGKELKLDPATVGRRVQRLEDDLRQTLFQKSPQGYQLSEAGSRLLVHADAAEQAVLQATDEMKGQSAMMSGVVRIGAPDGCANYLLPQVCAAIAASNPGLDIQIIALPRIFNLSKREADMAIGVSQPTAGRLTVQRIVDYRLHLAASKAYLRQASALNNLADLANHRVVGYIADLIFDKELDYLAEIGAPKVNVSSNSVAVQLNLLRQGAGVGIVHDFALPFAPAVQKVLVRQVSLTRSFYLIRHADDQRSGRLNRFAVALSEGLRAEVVRLETSVDET